MVQCNTCPAIGYWRGTTLMNLNGTVHRCPKGTHKDYFTYRHLKYPYSDEIDPSVERQCIIEKDFWTLYHYGVLYKRVRKGEKRNE